MKGALPRALCLALLLVAAMVGRAQAQSEATPEPVLVVDMQRIKAESQAGRGILRRTDDIRSRIQTEIAQRERAIRKEEQELAALKDELDPATFRERVRAFEAKVAESRDFAQRETRRLQSLLVSAGDQLKAESTRLLADMMRERKGKVLLDASQIVLSVDALDITDEAIARLDARLSEIPFGDPATAQE